MLAYITIGSILIYFVPTPDARYFLPISPILAITIGMCHDQYSKGKYKGWGPQLLLGTDVLGKTLGIIGLGNIGKALAHRMAEGFGVKILYSDLKRDKAFEKKYKAKYVSKEDLLKKSIRNSFFYSYE